MSDRPNLHLKSARATADENQNLSIDVQGHRGARGLRPENTLAGFAYAINLGVTTLEMDTGISKDGVLVVCHDPYINPSLCLDCRADRLFDSSRVLIKDLTVSEIQSYDCGSLNPDPTRFPNQQAVPGSKIPTLQAVFDLAESANPRIRYNIESKVSPLKSGETASPEVFAEKLVTIISQNNLVERATIQSFDWRVLRAVKQVNPQIQTVALVLHNSTSSTLKGMNGRSQFLAGFQLNDFRAVTELLQATGFIDLYSPNFETLLPDSPAFLQPLIDFQQAGFPVIPWTVNDSVIMQKLIDWRIDGLITDFPDILLNLLN